VAAAVRERRRERGAGGRVGRAPVGAQRQDGADEADDRVFIGEDADDVGASLDLLVQL
jgi:hypothetical protein